jgi:hypothetical protein
LSAAHGGANYHVDRRVRLDAPANSVYLSVEGQPALNQLRATAHVLPDRPTVRSPLVITHRWTEAGAAKEHIVTTAAATETYAFDAGADVVNQAIELRVDGTPR